MTRRKHADLIIAWANGSEIQVFDTLVRLGKIVVLPRHGMKPITTESNQRKNAISFQSFLTKKVWSL